MENTFKATPKGIMLMQAEPNKTYLVQILDTENSENENGQVCYISDGKLKMKAIILREANTDDSLTSKICRHDDLAAINTKKGSTLDKVQERAHQNNEHSIRPDLEEVKSPEKISQNSDTSSSKSKDSVSNASQIQSRRRRRNKENLSPANSFKKIESPSSSRSPKSKDAGLKNSLENKKPDENSPPKSKNSDKNDSESTLCVNKNAIQIAKEDEPQRISANGNANEEDRQNQIENSLKSIIDQKVKSKENEAPIITVSEEGQLMMQKSAGYSNLLKNTENSNCAIATNSSQKNANATLSFNSSHLFQENSQYPNSTSPLKMQDESFLSGNMSVILFKNSQSYIAPLDYKNIFSRDTYFVRSILKLREYTDLDFVGIIAEVESLLEPTCKDGRRTFMRKIYLMDAERDHIQMVLFGEDAEHLHFPKGTLARFCNVEFRIYGGQEQLYFNKKSSICEIDDQVIIDDQSVKENLKSLCHQIKSGIDIYKEKSRPVTFTPLSDINKEGTFTVKCKIVRFEHPAKQFYPACYLCKKKVSPSSSSCIDGHYNSDEIMKYMVKGTVSDGSVQKNITAFEPAALELMCGVEANQFKQWVDDEDINKLRQLYLTVLKKSYIFKIKAKRSKYGLDLLLEEITVDE